MTLTFKFDLVQGQISILRPWRKCVCGWAFTYLCDNTFPMVPRFDLDCWTCLVSDILVESLFLYWYKVNYGDIFWNIDNIALIFHMGSSTQLIILHLVLVTSHFLWFPVITNPRHRKWPTLTSDLEKLTIARLSHVLVVRVFIYIMQIPFDTFLLIIPCYDLNFLILALLGHHFQLLKLLCLT